MKKGEFKCAVCAAVRERGVYVQAQKGYYTRLVMKVCKKAECSKLGKKGEFKL